MIGVLLARSVDESPPIDPELAKSAQALVILGSGKAAQRRRVRRRHA
jgi:hypothetical protein